MKRIFSSALLCLTFFGGPKCISAQTAANINTYHGKFKVPSGMASAIIDYSLLATEKTGAVQLTYNAEQPSTAIPMNVRVVNKDGKVLLSLPQQIVLPNTKIATVELATLPVGRYYLELSDKDNAQPERVTLVVADKKTIHIGEQ